MDTTVRVLLVDPDVANAASMASLAEAEGIDVRTAVDKIGVIEQCRLGYLDLVMIDARDGTTGTHILQTIWTFRPTVRAVLMTRPVWMEKPLGLDPLRQLVRELQTRPRHVPHGLRGDLEESDQSEHRRRH